MPGGRGRLPTAVHHICVQCNIVHNQSFPCYGKLLQTIIGYSYLFSLYYFFIKLHLTTTT